MTTDHTYGVTDEHGRWWLDVAPAERFRALSEASFEDRDDYRTAVVPYLRRRGVTDEASMAGLIRADLINLAQGLTVVFVTDHDEILESMMPDHIYEVVRDVKPIIDHVGRELFGPLDFLLAMLRDLAPAVGLNHDPMPAGPKITEHGDAVFESVQVVEALRAFDPTVAGVTIAKIGFTDATDPSRTGCLELFQAALRDGSEPQHHRCTRARMRNLHAAAVDLEAGGTIEPPICHVSVEAPDVATVHELHEVAVADHSGLVVPYVDHVSVNKGDQSTNSKIAMRARPDAPVFNRIIEIVHHRT